MSKRVGRPARKELRKSLLTFFPVDLRDWIKKQALESGVSMSDWMDAQLTHWLDTYDTQPMHIAKTKTVAADGGWVAVQVVCLSLTSERLQRYVQDYAVSVAGIIYTVAKTLHEEA